MAWLKLDDKRVLHRKFRRKGFAVRGLDEAAMCHCAHDETDGFLSDEAFEDLAYHHGVSSAAAKKLAGVLVDVERWERTDERGGWNVLGYLDFNPSHDELEAQRQAKRSAGRKGGLRSGQVRAGRTTEVEASAEASASAGGEPSA